MFQSILIPIDHYAPHTDAAVAAAVDLAKLTGAAIHVVHAEEGISGIDSLAFGPLPADTAAKMRQEDIDLLEVARQRFADAGLAATTELLPRDGRSIHRWTLDTHVSSENGRTGGRRPDRARGRREFRTGRTVAGKRLAQDRPARAHSGSRDQIGVSILEIAFCPLKRSRPILAAIWTMGIGTGHTPALRFGRVTMAGQPLTSTFV